jgi:DNA-binding FadR family transcriptional regulator
MRQARAPLTASQRELYDLILEIQEHRGGLLTTQQELAEKYLRISRAAVQERLAALYRKGWLRSPWPPVPT